ncbi:hypothetical protein DFH11DRAFT_1506350 [Phellopilus nigrolimitatus]|nr:hypothetical protein DFH11DRAFT_1506350 [Phellopilus nigrolimitatus]
MPSNSFNLLGLPNELIHEVLSHCTSPRDVFNITRTCKNLQGICKSRQIWLSLLQNLDVTQAPDITPYDYLENFSTEEISSKVVRAVRLAYNMQINGALCYVQEKSLSINPHIPHVLESNATNVKRIGPQLLPGGNHAFLVNRGKLELWSFDPTACTPVWVAEKPGVPSVCSAFDFELVQDGEALNVAAAFSTRSGKIIRVYEFDFRSQEGKFMFERSIRDYSFPQLVVRGDIVMAIFQGSGRIFLLNWKIQGVIVLDYIPVSHPSHPLNSVAVLVDHHIVIASKFGTRHLKLAAISLSSLDGQWSTHSQWWKWKCIAYSSKIAHANDGEDQGVACLRLSDVPLDMDDNGMPGGKGPWLLAMHAFTPAWRKRTDPNVPVPGEIFVVAHHELSDKSHQLLSYRVKLSAHTVDVARRETAASDIIWNLSLVTRGCSEVPVKPMGISISNTGHMFMLHDGFVLCCQLFCSGKQPANKLSIHADILKDPKLCPTVMTVEPVTGALVIRTPGSLRVAQPE